MNPAKFLGMEERYMGSNPKSPTIEPSRLTGRGRKGIAFDLSVGSTIESHKRSGMAWREDLLGHVAVVVKAEAAERVDRAMAMVVFMVTWGLDKYPIEI